MEQDRALTTRTQYDDALAVAGAVADTYAHEQVFLTYQRRHPPNTRRRQRADLRLFCTYLAQMGVEQLHVQMIRENYGALLEQLAGSAEVSATPFSISCQWTISAANSKSSKSKPTHN